MSDEKKIMSCKDDALTNKAARWKGVRAINNPKVLFFGLVFTVSRYGMLLGSSCGAEETAVLDLLTQF